MNLVVISDSYPHRKEMRNAFVQTLVEELCRQGVNCDVIAPYSVTRNKSISTISQVNKEFPGRLNLYFPNYLSLSTLSIMGHSISSIMHKRAINRVLKRLKNKPDAIYCHFWCVATEVYEYASKNNIPLFVASGESSIDGLIYPCEMPDYVSGVICVSAKNKAESISLGLTQPDKCVVLPNSVNIRVFYARDRSLCRTKLNIADDIFVVAFVGSFDERKGAKRISDAIKTLNDKEIYSIFIGEGGDIPDCENILFIGKVKHKLLPDYLCAADVFVLPTKHEGCCNAIVEAMACGLPIISSDRDFNYDILNGDNSILVEPTDVNEIADAIKRLKDDSLLRNKMKNNVLASVSELNIENRASKIIQFIQERITKIK